MLIRGRSLGSLSSDESGAVAPTFAIAIVALVAVAGVGFDYTRMAALDSELQNAADQAALAGASQLDGKAGACARAVNAVRTYVTNNTRFANDARGSAITFQNETACDSTGRIRFWQNRDGTVAAANEAQARFIEVFVDSRVARYALTPLVDAFNSGEMNAAAMAGLGSSVCKVPPIMICSPDPSVPFNADARRGVGLVATGHSPGGGNNTSNQGGQAGSGSNTTWAPGDFGFLQVQDANATSRNAALLKALAYANPPIDCVKIEENRVSTGNPQGLYDAINTRFGIYDFNSNGNGNTLAPCEGGACPPAPNVRMDFQKTGNSCKINRSAGNGGNGFKLPQSNEYNPDTRNSPYNSAAAVSAAPAAMGLPRDNCHYMNYPGGGYCPGGTGRFGNGEWGRQDYFTKYHNASRPANWQTITRYETYLWELNGNMPTGGAPTCGLPAGDASRRVLTVAVVSNCAALSGASQPVVIDEWADVFLVEPSTDDAQRHNAFKDAIYMEIIGKSKIAGNGTYGSQEVRRDVPYLVR